VVSDHADELASWGLGEYGEGTSQYDAPKYTYSSSPAQYEPLKYGGNGDGGSSGGVGGGGGPPPSPYAEKYVKRLDNNPVSVNLNFSKPISFPTSRGQLSDRSTEFISCHSLANRRVRNTDCIFMPEY
jgi:hypothetical protein